MFESRVDHNHDLWTQHHTSYQAVAPLPAEASWSASTTSERQTTSSLGEESLGKVSQRSHQEILGDPARSEGSQEEQWKPQEVHRYSTNTWRTDTKLESLAECGLLRKPEQLPAVWFWVGSSLCLQRKQCGQAMQRDDLQIPLQHDARCSLAGIDFSGSAVAAKVAHSFAHVL